MGWRKSRQKEEINNTQLKSNIAIALEINDIQIKLVASCKFNQYNRITCTISARYQSSIENKPKIRFYLHSDYKLASFECAINPVVFFACADFINQLLTNVTIVHSHNDHIQTEQYGNLIQLENAKLYMHRSNSIECNKNGMTKAADHSGKSRSVGNKVVVIRCWNGELNLRVEHMKIGVRRLE